MPDKDVKRLSSNILLVIIRRSRKLLLIISLFLIVFFTMNFFFHFGNVRSSVDYTEKRILQNILGLTPLYRDNYAGNLTELEKIKSFDSLRVYPNLDFNVTWTKEPQYFWNPGLEKRFRDNEKSTKLPLKIIVVAHSHSDPGWGWTMEEYYNMRTRSTLNSAMSNMALYPNIKFLWSEASFLNIWWNSLETSDAQRETMKRLINSGRIEITTGGWVMTDEAIVHLYSMVDQLIEGQHWIHSNLNILPENGWSVDPFGHGPVMPYILKKASFENIVILRIHYAWKKWLAERKAGVFHWKQRWDSSEEGSSNILCHQHPYFMYLIGASLGPHTKMSSKFEFTSPKEKKVSDENLVELSELFLEEAGRTGSISRTNVVLAILGEDFGFQKPQNWKDNYENYEKLFKYINDNQKKYMAQVSWGSLKDYFAEIRTHDNFPTFKGDFFVYSDVITPKVKRPSYWSGFFATRPFWKRFYRQAESAARSAELLFSMALTRLGPQKMEELSTHIYSELKSARRNLALFAHHDGVPGVSSRRVMDDFGEKLLASIKSSVAVQIATVEALILKTTDVKIDLEFGDEIPLKFGKDLLKPKVLALKGDEEQREILVFNPLGWEINTLIKVIVNDSNVKIVDSKDEPLRSQISPVFSGGKRQLESFELGFIPLLKPLSLSKFTIKKCKSDHRNAAKVAEIYTDEGAGSFLKNTRLELNFNGETGYLWNVKKLGLFHDLKLDMTFGGYTSVHGFSGPYLFMQNGTQMFPEIPEMPKKYRISGQLYSKMHVFTDTIESTFEILHDGGKELEEAIFIENSIDSGSQDGEFFMRFDTGLTSKDKDPILYTDQSGFSYEKRVKVPEIGIEGNYYPITTMGWIQDPERDLRLSLIVDRAHGMSSYEEGRLEAMIERRVPHDDNRGIGQGVTDNRRTSSKYILYLEKIDELDEVEEIPYHAPSLKVHRLSQSLNYPPALFFPKEDGDHIPLNDPLFLLSQPLSEDVHLLNLRALPKVKDENSPSGFLLGILHRLPLVNSPGKEKEEPLFKTDTKFPSENVPILTRTDITGLRESSQFSSLHELTSKPSELTSFTATFDIENDN